jgi:hypothetical protein
MSKPHGQLGCCWSHDALRAEEESDGAGPRRLDSLPAAGGVATLSYVHV